MSHAPDLEHAPLTVDVCPTHGTFGRLEVHCGSGVVFEPDGRPDTFVIACEGERVYLTAGQLRALAYALVQMTNGSSPTQQIGTARVWEQLEAACTP